MELSWPTGNADTRQYCSDACVRLQSCAAHGNNNGMMCLYLLALEVPESQGCQDLKMREGSKGTLQCLLHD